jgi:hypothetical protein
MQGLLPLPVKRQIWGLDSLSEALRPLLTRWDEPPNGSGISRRSSDSRDEPFNVLLPGYPSDIRALGCGDLPQQESALSLVSWSHASSCFTRNRHECRSASLQDRSYEGACRQASRYVFDFQRWKVSKAQALVPVPGRGGTRYWPATGSVFLTFL